MYTTGILVLVKFAKFGLWEKLEKKLGTFPKAFYQVATSQMCNFPSGHFPIVCSRRSAHVSGTLDNLV